MRKNIKLGVGLLTVLATPVVINTVDGNEVQAASGWVKSGNTWYYYNTQGKIVQNTWVGNYWLDADGRMATNSWVDKNKYYVGADGLWVKNAKKVGWIQSGSIWYYYNAQGQMVRNAWAGNYWLGDDGRMVTNSWVDNNNYYVGHDGLWVKNAQKPGWTQKSGAWYYYNTQGQMVRNAWAGNYWLGADGRMATNSWVDNDKYYVGVDGLWDKEAKKPEDKKTGWVSNGGVWYYYDNKGNLVKNAWVGDYYLGSDGKMVVKSWIYDNTYKAWYYLGEDGVYKRNAWAGNYWLGSNGKMVVSSWVDNGRYYVDSTGKWIPNYGKENNAQPLNMPQYYQGDSRWGSKRYGLSTMRNAGCVPTSLAMAFSGLGKQVKPTDVADVIYYNTNEFNKREIGTSGRGAAYAIRHYGFNYSVIQSKEQLVQALQSGRPVFAAMANGYFVKGNYYTHAVILSGYQNGKTKAMDPDNVYTTGKWYDVNNIWNQRSFEPSDTVMGGSFMMIGNN